MKWICEECAAGDTCTYMDCAEHPPKYCPLDGVKGVCNWRKAPQEQPIDAKMIDMIQELAALGYQKFEIEADRVTAYPPEDVVCKAIK